MSEHMQVVPSHIQHDYESIVDLVEDLHMFLDEGFNDVRVEIGGVIFRPAKLASGGLDIKPIGPRSSSNEGPNLSTTPHQGGPIA